MPDKQFQMRMQCAYASEKNTVDALHIEQFINGAWQPFDLHVASPGFDIFVYSLFTCQHMYFRVNCAEKGLLLKTAIGAITVGADAEWNLQQLHVDFSGELASGEATQELIDYIAERMTKCPVSKNIRTVADSKTSVRFDAA